MGPWPIEIPQGSPFTRDNIPFGVFSTLQQPRRRVGVAIGEVILDLSILERSGRLDGCLPNGQSSHDSGSIFGQDSLNKFASFPALARRHLRETIIEWLGYPDSPLFQDTSSDGQVVVPMKDAQMHLPFRIGGFTDFMCADVHVENCSRLAGATKPPGHYAMPLGYNSRASSVIIGGEPIHRPRAIIPTGEANTYTFAPSRRMDYEAEIGVFISEAVPRGQTITADQAEDHIFGFVILNDWSARDVQFAEMTPLGPFNGKAFATSISPWVVTLDALRNARCTSSAVDLTTGGSTQALHLRHEDSKSTWNMQIEVSVYRSRSGGKPILTSTSNLRDLRWSPGQMLAHLASSGCGLCTGDLIGTGTISSPGDANDLRTLGCLFELTEGGKIAIQGSEGEQLTWLEDGDEVSMTVKAGDDGIGLGTLRSRLVGPRSA
ncbi:putative 2-hydroxyhepta-2,4-diene-1,7-dioate isomerase [Ilyonectria robusta]|uniref:putative 2-hydroxyhepta-2,4-diene-1,7-dioate isomerase n=1 Tax=Ilyonectria robusta TaxID=1079257 RepID=UPI001E8E9040|nr:putative 2-hydroxyhepta-2,4-diene-1,7-dioate isomerase [Ilyonectria robusta]KAH8683788.1 putative 2-hydroxyhepta-2,4-diene-1,7-dioate isomerase [Ilyonectria robusta]